MKDSSPKNVRLSLASSSPSHKNDHRPSCISLSSKGSLESRQSRFSLFGSPSNSGRRQSSFALLSFLSGENEERKRKASLAPDVYSEYTADLNANSMDIHPLHRDLPPHMWGVSLRDLDLFEAEVENAMQSGIIENYDSSHPDHNPHYLDPNIGPNIYQVNNHYIKPVTWRNGGMSFALMLNPSGLKCDVFATHAWREGIFEFVDKCHRAWPRNARTLWCCFLANPQNSDISKLLSGSVFDSPFAKALNYASYMMVLPNHDCSIYTRLWCVLEAKLAIEKQLDIVLLERISKRNTFIALLPTIAVGWLVYAYTYAMCYLFSLDNFGHAVIFVACICAPMILAAGVYYWSQGRFVRFEIHARMTMLACVSAILFSLLSNSDEFLKVLNESEMNQYESAAEDRCRFREVLNTTTDAVVLANIAFIALATTYKQSRKSRDAAQSSDELTQPFDSTGDGEDSDSDSSLDDDAGNNNAVLRSQSSLTYRSTASQRGRGHVFILWGEIVFLVWFVLELSVRLVGSFSVCPLLSVGNFVLELVFNTLSVIDIYLTWQASAGSRRGGHGHKRLACLSCCGVFSSIVAFTGKLTPYLTRVTRLRRLVRLLKLLRLARLVRLLEIPQTWWLCWGLVATFLIIGSWTILESALQEELRVSATQLDFTSVRDSTCSHADDQKRLFAAIKGKEDEIDKAVNVLRSAGKFDMDVRSLLELGLTVSRKNLRYNIHKAVHTGLLWGIFCVSSEVDTVWWIPMSVPLISIALAPCRRPRACRLNYAVLSWRRPVWATMVFTILVEVLGLSSPQVRASAKYAAQCWGTAVAAMGPNMALFIYCRLYRDPWQYRAQDFLLLLCTAALMIGCTGFSLRIHNHYYSCVASKVGRRPRTTVKIGDEDWDQAKSCYFSWLACYHALLFGYGLFWIICGIYFERRRMKVSGDLIQNDNTKMVKVHAVSREVAAKKVRASSNDSTTPLQWVELTERRFSHP